MLLAMGMGVHVPGSDDGISCAAEERETRATMLYPILVLSSRRTTRRMASRRMWRRREREQAMCTSRQQIQRHLRHTPRHRQNSWRSLLLKTFTWRRSSTKWTTVRNSFSAVSASTKAPTTTRSHQCWRCAREDCPLGVVRRSHVDCERLKDVLVSVTLLCKCAFDVLPSLWDPPVRMLKQTTQDQMMKWERTHREQKIR